MKQSKLILSLILGLLLSFSFISAMQIDFYYSQQCPHCQNVIPIINNLMNQYNKPYYIWNLFDTSQTSYDIPGVPTIKIKTNDCRYIEIVGDAPIINKLHCELQEMSTPECITYPAESNHKGSWFIN